MTDDTVFKDLIGDKQTVRELCDVYLNKLQAQQQLAQFAQTAVQQFTLQNMAQSGWQSFSNFLFNIQLTNIFG